MATYDQILQYKYPGRKWTLLNTADFSTLIWDSSNPDTKPTLDKMTQWNAETDTYLATVLTKETQAGKFVAANPDAVFAAIETLTQFCAELYRVLPANIQGTMSPTILTKGTNLLNGIAAIRAS